MAFKRKLELDAEDVASPHTKQPKLIPFPNYEADTDVAMSDAEPLFSEPHHMRLPSLASSVASTDSDTSATGSQASYPTFDLYPLPFINSEGVVDLNSHNYPHYSSQSPKALSIGLMQPSSNFQHHGTSCSQIPKLRVACASGLNGQRSMWSFCEQCGAISMVESD